MGLFDFLKRKELDRISQLESKVENLEKELKKYSPIQDIDAAVLEKQNQLDSIAQNILQKQDDSKHKLNELSTKYEQNLDIYKKLRTEVSLYESKLEIIEYGVYEPAFDFEHSENYKTTQKEIIAEQKEMIKDGTAAICYTEWEVSGSKAEGRKATKRYIKLALRAFNGECNTLIGKVKWNNVARFKERIIKSFNDINKLTESWNLSIQEKYLDLKIKELLLEHEFQLKKEAERTELKEAQARIREEEKAKREYEKAQKEAEKEEKNYQKALEKARIELEKSSGEKHAALQSEIEKLQAELVEAHNKKERAISMAQQTRSGHVYVISNIGSFGEEVYKIGMTRRLEPMDRVRELGDASVPFKFDKHAMIYSKDAPALEKELHKVFKDQQVNMMNSRKEFFKVSLNEIKEQVLKTGIQAEFIELPEATEYRETIALLEQLKNQNEIVSMEEQIEEEFPSSLD